MDSTEKKLTARKTVELILTEVHGGSLVSLNLTVSQSMCQAYEWPSKYAGQSLLSCLDDCTTRMLVAVIEWHVPTTRN